jgi:flagellar basal-body rod protein FlgB
VYVVWIYCFKFIAEKGESMINTNIYNYVNVLNKAADAANTRNTLLSNNIANVDTPNYKRKDIDFESLLQAELAGEKSLDKAVARANDDLTTLDPQVYTDNSSLSYRTDGNNVDIATEEAYLAENQIRYQALVDLMSQEFSRYNTVLSNGS